MMSWKPCRHRGSRVPPEEMPIGDWLRRRGLLNTQTVRIVERDDPNRDIPVVETDEGGRARVLFILPVSNRAIVVRIGGPTVFPFLAGRKSADGSFLTQGPTGWVAHAVECKVTLRTKSWRTAVEQLHGTLVRLRAVADFLGLSVVEKRAYVAMRQNKLDPRFSTNPAQLKAGGNRNEARALAAWMNGELPGPLFGQRVAVQAVMLDEDGYARHEL